ncbi:nitrogenase stabilizing/protective protein NifW [Bradyrhizobium sp. UFLA05-112]
MTDGILSQLKKTAAAEELFDLLGVKYDSKILNVARLHILQRMGQYLAGEDLSAATDVAVAERCRAVLERAYADFVASSPIDQRVFKVLKDAVAPQSKKATFVQLDLK